MIQNSNIANSIFPAEGTPYQTADEWYGTSAEKQLATLISQHNDIVSSEDDCRNEYATRQMFSRLAKQGRLAILGFLDNPWSAQSKSEPGTLPAPDNSALLVSDVTNSGPEMSLSTMETRS